jgi:murein DD-endopeptidase MepM/ murein hydrolase activator NlpD
MPRAWLLPSLAILAVTALGPVPALAGEPVSDHAVSPKVLKPDPIPEPRLQKPGQISGYRVPIVAGQEFRIYQGWNSTFSHKGANAYAYDIGMPIGTDVVAAAAGLVAFTNDGATACGGPELLRKANYVTIYHADGSATLYLHLSSVAVKVGDIVAAGQVIGKSGNTGYTNCVPHLHFARERQGSHGVTQSVPVYFQGYPRELHDGDAISVPAEPCAAPTGEGDNAQADAGAPNEPDTQAAAVKATEVADRSDFGIFCGVYYGGALDQPAAFVRRDGLLNFDWRSKGPGGYWLDSAKVGFAARWTGDFSFASAGTYSIGVIWSGSVRVSIDGVRVVDRWANQGPPTETLVAKALGAGIHRVDVEYLTENGHGMLKLGWGRLLADE